MVLCITHSADFYTIDIVERSLQQAGMQTFRLNTDEFATNCKLNYHLPNATDACLQYGDKKICASSITGVWYRKLWKLKVPPELDPAYQQVFTKEYQTYLNIFFNQLEHVPWMNWIRTDHAVSGDKFLQLSAAQAAALTIPPSVFTNDPQAIRQFFDKYNGDIIVKLHGSLSQSMEGNTAFFPTTRLSRQDLDRLDQLAYCPMIFQQYIQKDYELRIAYVDGEFFAGKIPNEESNLTDWRVIKNRQITWQHYELPANICEKLTTLMQQLKLRFGAIDMIRNKEGDYVFLEVNPQGEWGMLQKELNYPIGETIAKKLVTSINNG